MNIFDPEFLEIARRATLGISMEPEDITVLGWRVWFDDRPECNVKPWRIQHDIRIEAPFCDVPVGSVLRITTPFGAYEGQDLGFIDWSSVQWDDELVSENYWITKFWDVHNMEDLACDAPDFENNERIQYIDPSELACFPPPSKSRP